MSIENNRKELDLIDDKIAELFNKRMQIVEEIGKEKRETKGAVSDPNRERKILLRLSDSVDEKFLPYLKRLYGTVFETSKAYQSLLFGGAEISPELKKALTFREEKFPQKARVACQGVEGAYSELAATKLIDYADISFFKSFDGVFTAVEKGFSRYGVLPVENSYAGSVNRVYDLMKKHKFYIVKSIKLSVSHCLCAIPGAKKGDIKTVISHEQALMQCRNYLDGLGTLTLTPAENTAVAAKTVKELNDKTVATLCSKESVSLYGLEILEEAVQDTANNYTRFILISKEPELYHGANKISIMATLPHVAGSLSSVLSRFSAIGINLTKLESRPMDGGSFEFMFYFDFECDVLDPALHALLGEFEREGSLVFLGAYGEVKE